MGMITSRDQSGNGSSATYWRRRFLALVGGLAIFALLAWAVSGALGGAHAVSPAANVAKSGHRPGQGGAAPGGGAASRSPGPSSPGPSASATDPAASPSAVPAGTRSHPPAGPTSSPAPGHGTVHGTAHGGSPGGSHGATHGTGACPRTKVVISLFASQVSYSPRAWPQFELDVVSTSRKPCTFNVGATHLTLAIKAGSAAVWNSADCAGGRKSLVTDLVKGVPTVLPISWHRRTSAPGCKLASSAVPAGIYAATASSGQLTSNTEIFRLR